ncbi:MAG: hypothetical protein GXP08_18655 [Gammaproteobacteria bacterium]|nr:hypothetical protein [Gammaproteobacteria bacterium]
MIICHNTQTSNTIAFNALPRSTIVIFVILLTGMLSLASAVIASENTDNIKPVTALGIKKLRSEYWKLKNQLESNEDQFLLISNTIGGHSHSDVFGIINYPLDKARNMLVSSKEWCNAAILHINVKSCITDNLRKGNASVQLFVGDEDYLEPNDANSFLYHYRINDSNNDYISVALHADSGPLDTKQHRLTIEMIAISENSSFLRYAYSADFGFITRTVLNTYLSTIGRHKVGFTNQGNNKDGKPQFVTGIAGIMERNTMRYFFAFTAYLYGLNFPENQRFYVSMNQWFNYTEKYKRQLYEVKRNQYLDTKSQEYRNQLNLQTATQ